MEKVVQRVFHGTVVHSVELDRLEVLPRAWLGVDAAGRVAFLHHSGDDLNRSALSLKYSPLLCAHAAMLSDDV
jgi:hypothetical protein